MEIEKIITDLNQLNFTAIDFETANEKRDSICSIGLVVVENGEVILKENYFVKPHQLRFTEINKQIHGLSEKDVFDSPEFDAIWDKLANHFENKILLAHNAEFDISALRQTLDYYKITFPICKYVCTQKIAQQAFSQLTNYRLADVAQFLNMELEHHNSLSDALIAAHIGIKGIPLIDKKLYSYWTDELTTLISKKNSEEKSHDFLGYGRKNLDSKLLKPDLENADSTNPFFNKRIVFTGDMAAYSRQDAAVKIQKLGADINTAISKKTDIVIIGKGAGPSKMKKIEDLQSEGFTIRIIYEEEFISIINSHSIGI